MWLIFVAAIDRRNRVCVFYVLAKLFKTFFFNFSLLRLHTHCLLAYWLRLQGRAQKFEKGGPQFSTSKLPPEIK